MSLEEKLSLLVGREYGIITSLSEIPIQPAEPDLSVFVAEYQDPIALSGCTTLSPIDPRSRQASGAGLGRQEALWSTIGEAVERYAATNWLWYEHKLASAQEIPGGVEFLQRSILFDKADYARADFPYFGPDPSVQRRWVRAVGLADGRQSWAPSALIFLNYDACCPEEIPDRVYSTGLATHVDPNAAISSALYEVIERDAFASYWLTQSIPGAVSREFMDLNIDAPFMESIRNADIEFDVFALPTDVDIPVFACVVHVPDGGIAIGASCNPHAPTALHKSLLEAMHTYNWCIDLKRKGEAISDHRQLKQFSDHVRFYLHPENTAKFYWRANDEHRMDQLLERWFSKRKEGQQLEQTTGILAQCGFDPIAVDITSPDIRDIGFHVYKVFVPGMQPLSAGYGSVHTDTRRLEDFCKSRGSVFTDINPLPHPFP